MCSYSKCRTILRLYSEYCKITSLGGKVDCFFNYNNWFNKSVNFYGCFIPLPIVFIS